MKNIFLALLVCLFSLTSCNPESEDASEPKQSETTTPMPDNPEPTPDPTPDPGDPDPGNPMPNPTRTDKLCFLGSAGNGSRAQINVAKAMQQQDCKEIYLLGDLIYPWGVIAESDPLIQTNFFVPYKNLLDKNIRFNLVMGDSDYEGNAHIWMNVAFNNPMLNFPDMYYNHIKDDLCILALNTPEITEVGQVVWLQKTMENAQKTCKFILTMGHHSYLSVGHDGDAVGDIKTFLEEHIVSKADLYISAQDHILSDEGDAQGTRFLVCGGGGGELGHVASPQRTFAKSTYGFVAVDSVKNPAGIVTVNYSFIEVDEDGAAVTVHQGSVTPSR